jgi:hypothetical protein
MIEQRLRDSAQAWFPETPRLAPAVVAKLPSRPDPVGRRRPTRRALAVALAALVLTGTAIAATALDLVPGVRIAHVEELPEVGWVTPVFGEEATLDEVRPELPFEPVLPDALGAPDRLLLDYDLEGAPVVTAVWGGEVDARVVFTQWEAGYVLFDKLLTHWTTASYVDVFGAEGIWIEGGDHAVFYRGASGGEGRVGGHVTGNILVWHRGSVSYRLELGASRERALDLAESLRPVS